MIETWLKLNFLCCTRNLEVFSTSCDRGLVVVVIGNSSRERSEGENEQISKYVDILERLRKKTINAWNQHILRKKTIDVRNHQLGRHNTLKRSGKKSINAWNHYMHIKKINITTHVSCPAKSQKVCLCSRTDKYHQ